MPFTIGRLTERGQTVRDVGAQASWRGGARVPVEDGDRRAIEAFIEAGDEDGDGRVSVPTWVTLFEDGIVLRQRSALELGVDGDEALLSLELGLTRRGYNVLRDFEPATTGDAGLDAWVERASEALRVNMPPFRLNKRSGLLLGEGIGACVPWITTPPEPEATGTPAEDAAAASA